MRAAEVGDCLVPGSNSVSALPGRGPGVPGGGGGGSGRCRLGLSSSGQGQWATAVALAREGGGSSSWTEFCEPEEKPDRKSTRLNSSH